MRYLLVLLLSSWCVVTYAQAPTNDSKPNFGFGNNLQGTNGIDAGNVNAVQAYTKLQEAADAAYKKEDYETAYTLYHKLAEFGDKFSQYRVAYMHYNGIGTFQDPIEAYAWSYVAAETRKESLVDYHVSIRKRIPAARMETAKTKAKAYREDYGLHAIAYNARRLIREQKKRCVGSRLGNSCDRVSSAGITCNAFENGLPSKVCLTLGSVGLPAIAGLQPKDIRLVENNLESIMQQYSPGEVALGELEIIEDQ